MAPSPVSVELPVLRPKAFPRSGVHRRPHPTRSPWRLRRDRAPCGFVDGRRLRVRAMSTATTTRPRPGALPVSSSRRPRRQVLLSLVTLGVVAGGTWGLLAPRGAEDGDHPGHGATAVRTLDLDDGTLRIEGLVDKQVGHVMAGMAVAEDVPVGMRRFGVNVSLGATEDRSLVYSRRDFTVSGDGVLPVVPVEGQIGDGVLTPGRALSGSLSFDVPKEATSLSLQFRDEAPVRLPALPPVADGEHEPEPAPAPGTGEDHHDEAAVPAPAAGADHHDAPGAPAHTH